MANDLRIVLPNRPGALASTLDALAREQITVMSACGDMRPGERWGYLHLLVDDGSAARAVLERQKIEVVSEHHVEIHDIEPGAGALLQTLRSYLDRGDNVEVCYMAMDSRWVIGTESMRQEVIGVRVPEAGDLST